MLQLVPHTPELDLGTGRCFMSAGKKDCLGCPGTRVRRWNYSLRTCLHKPMVRSLLGDMSQCARTGPPGFWTELCQNVFDQVPTLTYSSKIVTFLPCNELRREPWRERVTQWDIKSDVILTLLSESQLSALGMSAPTSATHRAEYLHKGFPTLLICASHTALTPHTVRPK